MKVFLDTNILMDFVDNRENREYAKNIIELGKCGIIQLFASHLSFANMGYILRHRTQEERYRMIRNARKITTVLPCDATQLDCALAAGCDVIVTNNKRDFYEFCQIPFLTSEEFLLQIDF